jgi:hypothetical protein
MGGFAAGTILAVGGCSSSGGGTITCASGVACGAAPSPTPITGTLPAFTPPADPGPGGITFAASGEVLAFTGYAFPPASPDDAAFADGWDVHFTRLLVTVANVTLSEGPNIKPGDESCTQSTVATVAGPWAIDLSHSDPNNLPGKGGPGEEAVPFAALSKRSDGTAFDTSGATPYAFGFDLIPASPDAQNVNLDADGVADYQMMATKGCAVLYVGTATYNGTSCTCPGAPNDACPAFYGTSWPTVGQSVPFSLCFKSPTSYVNCQNPDNTGPALPGEESQRGIFFSSNQSIVGQVTIHTDHPFWDSVLHDSPAHFDQFAAGVAGMGQGGTFPTATLEATQGKDYAAFKDAAGNQLYWRYCQAPPTDVHSQFMGMMAFDPQSVPHATGSNGCTGLRDYYDFATYNQSTQGHLNSDGLCYVARHYPSPL